MQERFTGNEYVEAAQRLSPFIGRRDTYAIQLRDGRYARINEPLTLDRLIDHLTGRKTLATYILDEESSTTRLALDADTKAAFIQLQETAKALEKKEIPSYLELSRRGGHLWLFLDKPYAGRVARRLGVGISQVFELNVEIYPKQETIGKGVGSLIRLPFGVHRLTGRRYPFITTEGQLLAPTVREQLVILGHPKTIPPEVFDLYAPRPPNPEPVAAAQGSELDALKTVPLIPFIGQYVALKETAYGAIGKCPFHDDTVPSFAINKAGNYWNCFAGCGGGTIIDFWLKYRGVDVGEAVRQLKEITGLRDIGTDRTSEGGNSEE